MALIEILDLSVKISIMTRAKKIDIPVVDENIIEIDVSQEMKNSFLEYAYSVIYARALPDARDGLKPVQRRILYQMSQMGLTPTHGHVKSSRVVGDVMSRIHPHGDSPIYDAMVRLAQPFSMRVPLVDGHGNFGSLDDGPAASRYTEARLSAPAMAMVADLEEDTVDLYPNYDNSLMQPTVLPAALPGILVNGAQGIAVGMATNMPSHNIIEVCEGARYLLENPQANLEEIMKFIPGPDFPEGGKVVGIEGIRQAYATGRGTFKIQATSRIENITARKKGIVITELPYQIGPEKVIETLKDALQKGKVQGVSGVQNLTDRHHGLRLVIEVKNGFNPEAVLAMLHKFTPLEDSFAINNVAIVDGQPQTLGLLDILRVFLRHRQTVIKRRSLFRLAKAQKRLHLVEGLLLAVLDIDRVISIIRGSDNPAEAREKLQQEFSLSEEQAEYILEIRLRRLTKVSKIELESEQQQLQATIAELESILASQKLLDGVVAQELKEVSKAFGTPRRTILLEQEATLNVSASQTSSPSSSSTASIPLEVPDDPCYVLLSCTNIVAKVLSELPPPRQGARTTHDALQSCVATTARNDVGVVTSNGRLLRISALDLPTLPASASAPSLAGGSLISELVSLEPGEAVVGIVSLDSTSGPITLATAQGKIKRITYDYPERRNEFEIITLLPGDTVVNAFHADDNSQLVFVSSDAQLLHFPASAVRPQGRSGQGMAGISLREGAKVISAHALKRDDFSSAVVITVAGSSFALPGTGATTIKMTPFDRFPTKGRATGGVRCQRFLRGEDQLEIAWVGVDPRAQGSAGQCLELPELDERRDGSGSALVSPVSYIG